MSDKDIASHTPGPWSIYDDGPDGSDIILARVDGENYDLACISDDPEDGRPAAERKKNVLLMASSPDLAEALVSALEYLVANNDGDEFVVSRITKAQDALIKAGLFAPK